MSSRIPLRATCVFEGVYFKIMERYEKGFDGEEHLFQRILRKDYTMILPVDQEKKLIYIGDQKQPNKGKFYNFIGGIVERGEDEFQSAKRELLEETGRKGNQRDHYASYDFGWGMDGQAHLYIVSDLQKIQDQQLDTWTEKVDVIGVSLDDLIRLYHGDQRKGSSHLQMDMMQWKLDANARREFEERLWGH